MKLKEKASVAGVAANVYWRKKGYVDWLANLMPRPGGKFLVFSQELCFFVQRFFNLILVKIVQCGILGV